MTTDEQEQIIIDFVHGKCMDTRGNPIDIECQEIWENYQDQLHKPGCRGCIKKRVTAEYYSLVKKILHASIKLPGERMELKTYTD